MTFALPRVALSLAGLVTLSACASTPTRQDISFISADGAGCTAAYEAEMDRQDNQALGTFLGSGLIGVMITADDRAQSKTDAARELRACYDRTRTPAEQRLAIAATVSPAYAAANPTDTATRQQFVNPDRRGPNGGAGFSTF